jgi:hypothetical protein
MLFNVKYVIKMAFLSILASTIIDHSFAADRLCDVYDWMACPDAFGASRSTTGASMPLNSASAPSNPASMSTEKGFGAEVIKYKNWYDVSIVSGTGVVGSALSVSNNEGTFFGSVPLETEEEIRIRDIEKRKFRGEKFTGIFAVNIFGNKKGKNAFKANLGLIAKYNDETNNPNAGAGLALSLGPFSVGAARSRDDFLNKVDSTTHIYYLNSFTFGLRVANFAFDWTYMKNNAPYWSRARLITGTAFTKKFMFTYGIRKEESRSFVNSEFASGYNPHTDRKNDSFLGAQGIVNKNIIIGAFINYYLQNEISLGLTIFI